MIIKICGIKTIETLLFCEKKNVNFFGMIFYSKSPRNISIDDAKKLQIYSKNLNINGVGVFVNFNIDNLKRYIDDLELKYIQLHGNEDGKYIDNIKKTGVKIIKKISIKNDINLKELKNFNNADFFLFDYKPKDGELPGGNAKSFDWNILKDIKFDKPWFLSGGINLNNIHHIRSKINPYGVDLSSGVEKELGIKDNDIINNFMDKLNYA